MTTPVPLDEVEQVWRWRYRGFLNDGFDEVAAEYLTESDADLHRTHDMLEAGCSHKLAFKILTGKESP